MEMLHPHAFCRCWATTRLWHGLRGNACVSASLWWQRMCLCLALVFATVPRASELQSAVCEEAGAHALQSSVFRGRYAPTAIKMILAVYVLVPPSPSTATVCASTNDPFPCRIPHACV